MSEKLAGAAAAILGVWVAVRTGILDALIGGIIGDLTAEAVRLLVPLQSLLTAISIPAGIVGLIIAISPRHRRLGLEVAIGAVGVLFVGHLLPGLGGVISAGGTSMAASLSHAGTASLTGHP